MLVKQAANVVDLLEYFAERQSPATMPEIARDLGWPRSSTFNLIETLASRGYLYEPKARNGYYPTPRWTVKSAQVAQGEPLPDALDTLLAELADRVGETSSIVAPAGVSAVFLRVVECTLPIRYFAQVGHHVPMHASSSGRALLAHYQATEREALYRKIHFDSFSNGPAGPAEVERELQRGLQQGYHVSDGEYTPDLVGVAVPLPIASRRLAISVAGPRFRCLDRVGEIATVLHEVVERHVPSALSRSASART